jgi:hypothetical protein
LRAAGIPARYATGFSAQEWSRLDGAYLVRERHAHAWVRAWVDGAWRDLDTTPPTWLLSEAGQAPLWSPLADLWSSLRYRLSAWSARASARGWAETLLWLALPLGAWLAWRTLRGRRAGSTVPSDGAGPGMPRPGQDSELYLVERRLARLGHERQDAETVSEWLTRIKSQIGPEGESETLQRLAQLHYRHRFDPAGLPASEREALRAQALAWLARHPAPG